MFLTLTPAWKVMQLVLVNRWTKIGRANPRFTPFTVLERVKYKHMNK